MTRKKYWTFALLAMTGAVVATIGVLLAADIYAHGRMATSAGLNIWGYRGATVGRKQPGERRIVVLGESTAFGYGVTADKAFPALLQERLKQRDALGDAPVSVVNLAYNNEGAHSYRFTLDDYAYLNYDAAVFYSGYNDSRGLNLQVYRHGSPIFRWTGYMPILPLVLREKSMAIRYGGELEKAYRGEKTLFKPSFAQSTTASVMSALATSLSAGDRGANSEGVEADPQALIDGASCGERWAHYCGGMYAAVKYALDHQKQVLLVRQPWLFDRLAQHKDQQEHLWAFLKARFPGNPRLHFADLSEAVDVRDETLCFDRMHLNAAGNQIIADALTPAVVSLFR